VQISLTVLFDDPFWVGVFERLDGGRLSAARVVFGAEPTTPEILAFVRSAYYREVQFSRVKLEVKKSSDRVSPKRAVREAKRIGAARGTTSMAQEAMRLELETRKLERKVKSREEREAEAERQFEIRRAKAKKKHRGR
jgi:Protein of unknown function (DUF2992)